jgi:hypothetical protein
VKRLVVELNGFLIAEITGRERDQPVEAFQIFMQSHGHKIAQGESHEMYGYVLLENWFTTRGYDVTLRASERDSFIGRLITRLCLRLARRVYSHYGYSVFEKQ